MTQTAHDRARRLYKQRFEQDLEPERYEIFALLEDLTPDRRRFLQLLGGGLFFLVTVRAQDRAVPVRVQVTEQGTYRAFTGKMEMGQGARTLLAQAFAEELGVAVDAVDLVMGDTLLCPDDGGSWASLTTPQTVPVIRQAAAAVRAARSGGSHALTAPHRWNILGQPTRNVRARAIVTGAKVYPSDTTVPGMLHAVIVRSPHHRATLQEYDTTAAQAIDGVRMLRDGDLLAAVAPTPTLARRAAALVRATWTPEPLAPQDGWADQFERTAVPPTPQPEARYPPLLEQGDVGEALRTASKRLSSRYEIASIAHVPLEPRAAVAIWTGDEVTIHGGVQAPFLARQEVARALDVPQAKVRVIAMDNGGAFGGKQRAECEVEAARLARLAGAPVRVAWTRDEEFTCSYTRPAGLVRIESGVDAQGQLVALRFANYNSGASGLASPYDVPHRWVGFYRAQAVVRQGSYRALAAVANTFARESHMDEWAAELGVDSMAFRLRHVHDTRLRHVVERTAERFGWQRLRAARQPPRSGRRGMGMSCTIEKGARLALCVEVEVHNDVVRLTRLVATGDFGAALNPRHLQAQMSGAIVQGLGGALWERVAYDGTTQQTRHLSEYRVPAFADIPPMDVQIVDRRDVEAAGAGESPITLPAPAIAAAIFDATGMRRRILPLLPLR